MVKPRVVVKCSHASFSLLGCKGKNEWGQKAWWSEGPIGHDLGMGGGKMLVGEVKAVLVQRSCFRAAYIFVLGCDQVITSTLAVQPSASLRKIHQQCYQQWVMKKANLFGDHWLSVNRLENEASTLCWARWVSVSLSVLQGYIELARMLGGRCDGVCIR